MKNIKIVEKLPEDGISLIDKSELIPLVIEENCVKVDGKKILNTSEKNSFAKMAIFLSKDYNWEIIQNEKGVPMLIAKI